LTDWLGVDTTILAVEVGLILGAGIGFWTGLVLGCVPTALFCITFAADPPPHAPHAIIVWPFSHQCVGYVLAGVFAALA